jgi:AraC-like DNA-binding protein
MSSGINVSTADIIALRDSDHAVTFPRSLSLVFSLEGRPSEVNAGRGRETVILQPGKAALFSVNDEEETRARYRAGHCSKSILLQLRPGMMADEGLADFVEQQVRSGELILQAAHFTGYNHAGNFCTAYHKHFGHSSGSTEKREA